MIKGLFKNPPAPRVKRTCDSLLARFILYGLVFPSSVTSGDHIFDSDLQKAKNDKLSYSESVND